MEVLLGAFVVVAVVVGAILIGILLRQSANRADPAFLAGQFQQSTALFRQEMQQQGSTLRQELQSLVENFRQEVSGRLGTMTEEVGKRLEVFGEVKTNLGHLSKATEEVEKLGQTLSSGISSIQGLLQPPKLRGELGEQMLELVLSQVLPPGAYVANYRFQDGTQVEFAIKTSLGVVPVDAKFPMEAFQRVIASSTEEDRQRALRDLARAVRAKADDAAKYIRPDQGTLDFALMYVPADGVYYSVFGSGDQQLWQHCAGRRVFPASPSLLYPLLASIALGLKGLQVEREARRILETLGTLDREFAQVQETFSRARRQLGNAKDNLDDAARSLDAFSSRLSAVATGAPEIDRGETASLPAP